MNVMRKIGGWGREECDGWRGKGWETPATLCMAVIKPKTSFFQVKPLLAVWRAGEELKDKDVSVPQII